MKLLLQYLEHTFQNRWIWRFRSVPWLARSPDLTPLNFYLWGHMKSLICETSVELEMDLVGMRVDDADSLRVFDRARESLLRR